MAHRYTKSWGEAGLERIAAVSRLIERNWVQSLGGSNGIFGTTIVDGLRGELRWFSIMALRHGCRGSVVRVFIVACFKRIL